MRPANESPLLELTHVTSGYGAIVAVRDVSLRVNEGEIVALIGANGAGKSTMLMTIAGLVNAREGAVRFAGEDIGKLQAEEIVRRGIALAPEGRRVFARLTVADNLRLGAATRRDRDEISADIDEMSELFPVLKQRRKQLAGTLSGGEQQMLAVARSLMSRPKMLLLDEPSLGLAPRVVAQIYELLLQMPQRGVAVLLVEQQVSLALDVAARGYVMSTGEIALSGSAEDLTHAVDLEQVYLGSESERGA